MMDMLTSKLDNETFHYDCMRFRTNLLNSCNFWQKTSACDITSLEFHYVLLHRYFCVWTEWSSDWPMWLECARSQY